MLCAQAKLPSCSHKRLFIGLAQAECFPAKQSIMQGVIHRYPVLAFKLGADQEGGMPGFFTFAFYICILHFTFA